MPHDDRRPVTPTRVIPAGAPLPARPPEPGEADPGPRIVEVRHIHEVLLVSPDPDPEPRPRLWERLWELLFTWRMLVAILAAVVPWIGGQSPVGVWSHTVHQARAEAGIGAAYVIAGVALAAAWALDRHTGRAVPRALLITASLGAFGVLHWWDPILALTGVDL
ncbi:hypothetical protein ACFZCT_29090 [Streptomyces qaidamensis]|uniref:hypothetical protein n=1 Tax=Streptomyces qaidamensis TaxID=1783515 RepID=UPI0036EAEE26